MSHDAVETPVQTAPAGGTASDPAQGHPIVFIDGVCVFCENSMQMIFAHDRRRLFRFAPLQGPTAARLLTDMSAAEMLQGVVLYEQGRVLQGYPAVLRISALLYPWLAWGVFLLRLPGLFQLGRLGYTILARNRYKWFGQKNACLMPDGDIRAVLLD